MKTSSDALSLDLQPAKVDDPFCPKLLWVQYTFTMAGPHLFLTPQEAAEALPLSAYEQDGRTPGVKFLDALLVLFKRKRTILAVSASAFLLSIVLCLVLKPTYTATALIMPPQSPQSSLSSLMGQLGSLSALSGGGGSLLKNPADLYVGILESRTIADSAITTFRLQQQWRTKSMWETRKRLAQQVQLEAQKNGLIKITAKDGDPKQASDLANFFVDALYRVNSTLAISEASQRRVFFDEEVNQEKAALAHAEEDLKQTQQKTGLLSLSGQAELAIRSVAQVRADIASKQVALQGLLAYDAEENPAVIQLRQEVQALQRQLATLENNQQQQAPGDTQISANQVPGGSLEYVRKLREVKYHDALYEALSRQYEAARIDEAKSAPIIQVVDRSVPPDHKSGPPRLLIIVGLTLFGFLASCGWILIRAAITQAQETPVIAIRLRLLLDQLAWRRV